MANANRCPSCQTKVGVQVPGRCSECPGGTHQKMVKLCPTCSRGRCEVCKTPLLPPSGTATRNQSDEPLFGAGPTGFGGC